MMQVLLAQADSIDERTGGAAKPPPARAPRSSDGRLVRVSKCAGDPQAVVYIVAITAASRAIAVIRREIVRPSGQGNDCRIEDLGRVSEALLKALGLSPGEFARADTPSRK